MQLRHAVLATLISCLSVTTLTGCDDDENAKPTPIPAAHIFGTGEAALVNGSAIQARFNNPVNVEVATDGTVFVADYDNDVVRKISLTGQVTTLIQQSGFQRPFGLTLSSDGSQLFIETDGNDLGQRNATTGTIWRLNLLTVGAVPEVLVRNIGRPRGIVYLPDGRIALSDIAHHVVSVFNPSTKVVTPLAGQVDQAGFVNGKGTVARFNRPYGLALADDGALLVADQNNNSIRKVTLEGVVTTFAGLGPAKAGKVNGNVATATFDLPQDVAVNGRKVYVADHDNYLIRLIDQNVVSTVAGNGVAGFVDAEGTAASFFGVEGFAITSDGKNLWLADGNNGDGGPYNRVRRLVVQ